MFPGESVFILSGSLLSALGSIFIIICHTHLGVKDSVRTKLIFCLAVADLLNALNNSASGFVSVAGIPLADGPLCTLNGFVGQWTVVASDFSVLAIAIATVTAVTRPLKWYSKSTWVQKYVAWIIGVIWIYALITALVALFAVGYSQSAANWCWINKTPFYARYALTHIPRMIIIFSIFVAYAFVYVFLKRMTKNPTRARSLSTGSARGEESGVGISDQESEPSTESSSLKPSFSQRALSFSKSRRSVSEGNNKRDPILRLMRLMVIFPVVYTLLWLPGLANRLYDAVMPEGSQTPEFMEYLQGLTQYIGFANAVLYGLNDEILKAMKKKWGRSNSEASQTDSALEA